MDSIDDLEEAVVGYMDKGIVLIIADILSLITVSSCLFIKIPQINTIRQNKSSQEPIGSQKKCDCSYVIIATLKFILNYSLIILQFLVPFCTPIGATSKVLQLLAILKSKDASSVSRTTWALSAFTNFTRIYTVYVQSHDWMLLSNFMISTFLSSSVFVAACVYKKKSKKE
ncbi:hypothetical protein DOY81_009566 [Sarcophaga bullata]|nr:hypothetical protein DOY81_009566 [Sarcophaga bullata]